MIILYFTTDLPLNYGIDGKSKFLLDARADLFRQIDGQKSTISDAKIIFRDSVVEKNYRKVVEEVELYYGRTSPDFSALKVVCKILMSCPASEAGAERFFSYEKIIHSDLGNRMKPEMVRAIMQIKCNQKIVNK